MKSTLIFFLVVVIGVLAWKVAEGPFTASTGETREASVHERSQSTTESSGPDDGITVESIPVQTTAFKQEEEGSASEAGSKIAIKKPPALDLYTRTAAEYAGEPRQVIEALLTTQEAMDAFTGVLGKVQARRSTMEGKMGQQGKKELKRRLADGEYLSASSIQDLGRIYAMVPKDAFHFQYSDNRDPGAKILYWTHGMSDPMDVLFEERRVVDAENRADVTQLLGELRSR